MCESQQNNKCATNRSNKTRHTHKNAHTHTAVAKQRGNKSNRTNAKTQTQAETDLRRQRRPLALNVCHNCVNFAHNRLDVGPAASAAAAELARFVIDAPRHAQRNVVLAALRDVNLRWRPVLAKNVAGVSADLVDRLAPALTVAEEPSPSLGAAGSGGSGSSCSSLIVCDSVSSMCRCGSRRHN